LEVFETLQSRAHLEVFEKLQSRAHTSVVLCLISALLLKRDPTRSRIKE
jgi:hypothetical protein